MFKNKRILVTEYVKDRKLYEDVLQFLLQEKSVVIALVDKANMADSMKRYPRITSIALDVDKLAAKLSEQYANQGSMVFRETNPETVLLENLPFVNYVLNFSGDVFINHFVEVQRTIGSKIHYELKEVVLSSVRPKLKDKSLIPQKYPDSTTIVQIIPDISIGQTIRESFGKLGKSSKHKENIDVNIIEGENPKEELRSNIHISRSSVFRRTLSLRIRRSYPVRRVLNGLEEPPVLSLNIDLEFDNLFIKENDKIKKSIEKLFTKISEKEKRNYKKLHKVHESKENKLNKEVKQAKLEKVEEAEQQVEPLNEQTKSRSHALGEDTANKIIESRKKLAIRRGVKSAVRIHNVEARILEQELENGLKELKKDSYNKLLFKEAKVLRKIKKKYLEKRKAIEKIYHRETETKS